MELWRLRAREFLSARSTQDSREDESLAEALSSSSPNSAPRNWGGGAEGGRNDSVTEEQQRLEGLIATGWRSSANHLLLLQRNLGLDGQDQIRGGVPQLANVLVDVVAHIVVHVAGERGKDGKEVKDPPKYNTHTHKRTERMLPL